MDTVYNLISSFFKIKHGVGKEVPSSSLDSGLEDATADQLVPSPLPAVSILAMNRNAELFGAPWSGDQLELWPLPTNQPTTG